MSTDATTGKGPAPRIVRIGLVAAPLLAAAATFGMVRVSGVRLAWIPFGAALSPEAWQQPLSVLNRASLDAYVAAAAAISPANVVSAAATTAAVLGGTSAAALVVLLQRAGLRVIHALLLALVASTAPLALWQASSPFGQLPVTAASLALLAVVTSTRVRWSTWSRHRGVVGAALVAAGVITFLLSASPWPLLRLVRGELGLVGLVLLAGHLVARHRPATLLPVVCASALLLAVGSVLPAPDRLALLLPWLWWLVGAGLAALLAERPAHAAWWASIGLAGWAALNVAQVPWVERRQAAAAARTWADGVAAIVDRTRPLTAEPSAGGQLVAALVKARHGTGALSTANLRAAVDDGHTPVVVDASVRDRWRDAGVGFAAPVTQAGIPLHATLDAFPAGTVVLAAISQEAASRLSALDWQALARIGVRSADGSQPRAHVLVGQTRVRGAGLHTADPQHARLEVQPGDPIGRVDARVPIEARLEATATDVTLTVRGRPLHAGRGLVVAFWTTRGELVTWRSGSDPARLHGAPLGRALPTVSQAVATLPCVEVGPAAPADVTAAARAGGLVLTASGPTRVSVEVLSPEGAIAGPVTWMDGAVTAATKRMIDGRRVEVETTAPVAARLALRRRVTRATASATRPVTVCGAWPVTEAFATESLALRVDMGAGDEVYLGDGWHDREAAGQGHFRWMAARQASWLVALRDAAALEVIVDAQTVDPPQSGDVIGLTVNDHPLPARRVETQRATYRWSVPAAAWRRGLNTIVIDAPRTLRPADRQPGADGRTLGLAIHGWSLSAREGRQERRYADTQP